MAKILRPTRYQVRPCQVSTFGFYMACSIHSIDPFYTVCSIHGIDPFYTACSIHAIDPETHKVPGQTMPGLCLEF